MTFLLLPLTCCHTLVVPRSVGQRHGICGAYCMRTCMLHNDVLQTVYRLVLCGQQLQGVYFCLIAGRVLFLLQGVYLGFNGLRKLQGEAFSLWTDRKINYTVRTQEIKSGWVYNLYLIAVPDQASLDTVLVFQ